MFSLFQFAELVPKTAVMERGSDTRSRLWFQGVQSWSSGTWVCSHIEPQAHLEWSQLRFAKAVRNLWRVSLNGEVKVCQAKYSRRTNSRYSRVFARQGMTLFLQRSCCSFAQPFPVWHALLMYYSHSRPPSLTSRGLIHIPLFLRQGPSVSQLISQITHSFIVIFRFGTSTSWMIGCCYALV
jgi:hypothetical protein